MPAIGFTQQTPYGARLRSDAADQRADFWKKVVLPVAGFATGGAALGALGGGSAAAGAGAVNGLQLAPYAGTVAAHAPGITAAAGGGMTFGNLLSLGQMGAGLVTNAFGMRSQGRQNAQDAMTRQRELSEQMDFARETEAQRKAEFAAQQAAQEKQWAADQQFKQGQWNASEEERLYARRLQDEKEARKAQNRLRLADLIRLGR